MAFINNRKIQKIVIPASVQTIGKGAFWYCTNLEKVIFKGKPTKIKNFAFYRTAIRSMKIPEGTTRIYPRLFEYCRNLKEVYIPASVQTIGRDAFRQSGVKDIFYAGTVAQWKDVVKELNRAYSGWFATSRKDPLLCGTIHCSDGTIKKGIVCGDAAGTEADEQLKRPGNLTIGVAKKYSGEYTPVITWDEVDGAEEYVVFEKVPDRKTYYPVFHSKTRKFITEPSSYYAQKTRGDTYRYRIYAVDKKGNLGEASKVIKIVIPVGPENGSVIKKSDEEVTVTWDTTKCDGYKITVYLERRDKEDRKSVV